MRGLAYVLYLGLGLFQIAATIAGIQYWLGFHWLIAAVIAFFTASWPVVGTILGMVGAHYAWGWSWFAAFLLFFGSLILIFGIALATGVFSRARG